MVSILETTRFAIKSNDQLVKKASSLLQQHFNLNNFYYYRIDDLGNYFLFDDNLDVVDSLDASGFILKFAYYCHPKYHSSMTKIESTHDDPDLEGLESTKDYFLKSSFNLGLRLVNRTHNAVEEFGFHSSLADEKQHRCLLNHLSELRLFAQWFLEQNAHSLAFLRENALNLSNLIGADFYRNRIQDANPVHVTRRKLLKELGIGADFQPTETELDTIRLMMRGLTADQISKQVFRSRRTIEHRIERLKAKMQVSSRSELIQKAQVLFLGHQRLKLVS